MRRSELCVSRQAKSTDLKDLLMIESTMVSTIRVDETPLEAAQDIVRSSIVVHKTI